MSSSNPTNFKKFVTPSQYKIEQPYNIVLFFTYFSPIIIITCITFLSFVFQNVKGLVYLGYIFCAVVVRYYIYHISSSSSSSAAQNLNMICNSVSYSYYGNITFSIFIFTFTLLYIFLPMFMYKHVNYAIFIFLTAYCILDIFIKYYNNCYKLISLNELLYNFFGGALMSVGIILAMFYGGGQKYLFFNEINNDENVCYKPSNQQFKCKVYKNGEIIASTNSM